MEIFKRTPQQADFEYFAIYDTKTMTYNSPMLSINEHSMIREITQLFQDKNQEKNQYFTNAEDFQLFSIGNYTKRTGTIQAWAPKHIANLHEIKAALKTQDIGPHKITGLS